jgi:hypothetical protein
MGAHRKPKTRPTAFAAVVTAAIVVPAGTAAAASYGGLGPAKSGTRDVSAAGQLAARAHTAATTAANARIRHVAITPTPTASKSAPRPAAKASPSTPPPTSATSATASKPPTTKPKPSASASASTPAAPATTAKPNPYKNVSLASLEPTGLYRAQQYVTLSSAQWANARTIVAVTEQRGMPLYAAVVAMATAMQESALTNLTYATNYDSLGLFQQRPSMGWGTAAQVTDPVYATNAFLSALATYAPNYGSQSLWTSAQAVQRSGLPTAYAQWEDQAAQIVRAIANGTA